MGQLQKVHPICKENRTRRREKKAKEICEVMMAKNFPKWMTYTNPQIQEAQKTPSRINNKAPHLEISYTNCRTLKAKSICWKKQEEWETLRKTFTYEGTKKKNLHWTSCQKPWECEENRVRYSQCWKKSSPTLEIYIQSYYPSKLKEKYLPKGWETLSSADWPYKKVLQSSERRKW